MPTSEPPVVPLPPWSVLSPPGVSFPVSGLVSVVVPSPNRAEAFFSVPSRLRFRQLKSPVPRALIFKPSMFLAMVNSFSVAAPALFLIPMERMARSAISDARYHVGNHTLNRSSRKWGVVTCHVIYELVDVVGLSDDRIGEELAIGIRHLLIDVLF